MIKLVRVLVACLALGSVGGAVVVQAQSYNACCDPCYSDCCCWDGCFQIGASAIWWRPSTPYFEYGRVNTTSSGAFVAVEPAGFHAEYQWGFQIFGGWFPHNACWFGHAKWNYLNRSKNHGRIEDPIIPVFTTNTAQLSATAKSRFEYNQVYARLGYYLQRNCYVDFYTYGGLRWVDVRVRFTIEGINSDDELNVYRERTETWAVGIETGFGGEYHLGCGFNLNGRMGFFGGVGEQKHFFGSPTVTTVASAAETQIPTQVFCLPGFDARFGVNFTYECCCTEIVLELAYEMDYYFDAITVKNAESVFSSWHDVGFAGPVLSLSVCF